MKTILLALATLAMLLPAAAAGPDRPITIVVPYSAGGPTDKLARDLARALRRQLEPRAIVIENVAGAGGTLGTARVARAAPDGATLLLQHIGMATAPALYRKLPYRAPDDFETLGLVSEVPMTLIGKPGLPARNLAELRRWLEANRGHVNLANAGLGAAWHLCGLLLQQRLGIDMNTVPYKGTAPALTDLLGGQVDLMCDQSTNTAGPIAAGRVQAYGVTTLRRLKTPALAALPTLDESGLRGFEVTVWHGLYAPRGTPPATVERLNGALRAALKDPDFVHGEQAIGAVIVDDARNTPVGHRRFVEAERDRWGRVIRTAGPYAD